MTQWSAGLLRAPLNSDPGMKLLEQAVNTAPHYDPFTGEQGVVDPTYPIGNIRRYGALPSASAVVNTGAIQACITASPGPVYTPAGQYRITGTGSELLLASKSVVLVGDGLAASQWVVAYDVANTTSVLRVQGTNFDGWRMETMSVVPEAAPFVAGVGTVTLVAGVATFSTSQAGVITRNGQLRVGASTYLVLSFNGTTGAVVSGAPTVGASAFTYSRVPAQHGVVWDVQTGYVANAVTEHVKIGPFGDDAARCRNPVPAVDGLFLVSITDSVLVGGLGLLKAGDNVSLKRSNFPGAGAIVVDLVPGTDGGAHGFEVIGGNITCSGGLQVLNASACYINPNNMEAPYVSTGPNAALIDLAGTAASPLGGVIIDGGYLGGTTGNVDCCIRSDYVVKPSFRHNYNVAPGNLTDVTPRCIWRVTTHAIGVEIVSPYISPFGLLLETVLDDQGVGTEVNGWISPVGINPVYIGHKAQKSTTIIHQAGKSQSTTTPIFAIVPSALPNVTATVNGAGALIGATSVPVAALSGYIPVATFLTFTGGKVVQLSGPALAGDTTLSVVALAVNLVAGDAATYSGGGAYGDLQAVGHLRVQGNGNTIVGNGADVGSRFQVNGSSFYVGDITANGDLVLVATHSVSGKDTAGTIIGQLSFNVSGDNVVRIGTQTAPATGGELLLLYRGTEIARAESGALKIAAASVLKVGTNQVIGPRATGWSAQTTALARGDMGAAPTLATVASTLAALITDLRAHGLINT